MRVSCLGWLVSVEGWSLPFSAYKIQKIPALILISYLALTAPQNVHSEIQLPDIGDPATSILSPAEEQRLGSVILSQIRRSLNVINDAEIHTYINSLGTKLVTAGLDSDIDFTFLCVQDPTLNAFAAPGGIIAVNTGLIRATASESELAGVVAHEIAHIKQRHLARAYANASQINIATALGVLAAIATGIYNPELGGAALHSTLAAGTQATLSFSRDNEQEADRIGMQLLANAKFDPMGMPDFFTQMHRHSQINSGPVLEFLSTHPVTLSRISDTRSRAAQFSGPFLKDSERFQYAKARIVALTTNPATIIDQYESKIKIGKLTNNADRYMYAIALTRLKRSDEAITLLTRLKENEHTDLLAINLALAQAFLAADEPAKASAVLKKLDKIYPSQEAIVYYLAKSLIDLNRPREALSKLEHISVYKHNNPLLEGLKAKAAAEANLPWISHEAMADYYIAYGQYGSAMDQFELALSDNRIDAVAQARIRSKRKELRRLNEQRR